jgi:hypothetical protein
MNHLDELGAERFVRCRGAFSVFRFFQPMNGETENKFPRIYVLGERHATAQNLELLDEPCSPSNDVARTALLTARSTAHGMAGRSGRVLDHETEDTFERLRADGYM